MEDSSAIAFIVGLGAPASLYNVFLEELKSKLLSKKIFILEWWNEDDFGFTSLKSRINNSNAILIGHSAGGIIALQALDKWPNSIKKIIMLDSHFLSSRKTLPSISQMLEIMLSKDNNTIKNKVESAYAPVVANDLAFNKAFSYAIDWVQADFNRVCATIKNKPEHSVLHIGFTNNHYQPFTHEDEKAQQETWKKFAVDTLSMPMSHFDLIDSGHAASLNQVIVEWLSSPRGV